MRGWSWHLGLGPQVGYVFWAMVGVEATFGAYVGIWPLWIQALGAPVTVVGLVLGSSGLLRLLVLAPSATLAEQVAPGKLMALARAAAAIGLVTAGLATHWTQLAPMIVGSALGEIAFPLSQDHLARHAGERRVRAFALVFNVGPAVAFGIAPLVSGGLIARFGMRAAFFFAAACALCSVAFFLRFAPPRRAPAEPDGEAAKPGTGSYAEALRVPALRRLLALQFATVFALSLGISLLPTFLNEERGITPAVVAGLGGIGSIGSVLFGLVVARSPRLQAVPLVAVAIAACFVVTTLLVSVATTVLWLIVVAFLGRGGLWSAWGLFVAALGEAVPNDRLRPRVFALSEMTGGTAFFSAPMLAGVLYAVRPDLPLLAAIGAALVLVPVLLLAQRRLPAAAPVPAAMPAVEEVG